MTTYIKRVPQFDAVHFTKLADLDAMVRLTRNGFQVHTQHGRLIARLKVTDLVSSVEEGGDLVINQGQYLVRDENMVCTVMDTGEFDRMFEVAPC